MSQRVERVSSSIHKIAATVLRQELRGGNVTVTEVEVTPDLKEATIWVSVFDDKNEAGLLEEIQKHRGAISTQIARAIHMRRTPRITIKQDSRHKRAQAISDKLRSS